jgi:hypothetical protein
MKSLVLLAALLLVGCSVEVAHESDNKSQTESLLISDRSKTVVAVGILEVPESSPESRHTDSHESTTSQTTAKVIVPEPSPEVVNSPPPVAKSPEPTIQISGSGNCIALGDIHHHHHKHFHIRSTPKPHPVRINVRVELNDRIGERERRRRMVERRISSVFPNY